MPEPRAQVIRRFARDLHHPNPEGITYGSLVAHIDTLPPDGWVHPDDIRAQLNLELDGARPLT